MNKNILALLLVFCIPFFLGMKETETSAPLKRWVVVFNEKVVDCRQENLNRIVLEYFKSVQLSIIRPYQNCGLIIEIPGPESVLEDLPEEFLFMEPDQKNNILIR
ncbi:hypothetical protein [Spongorhabdus nitratireducens]